MRDSFNREINYLRISVTDRCSMRCFYCDPRGENQECGESGKEMSLEEILLVVSAAAELGIRHIRLTGGEPLLRSDIAEMVHRIKKTEGVETVSLTTNGLLLTRKLPDLLQAGLDAVNISLDTTDPIRFQELTGSSQLDQVITAILCAAESGIRTKVNAVSVSDDITNYTRLIDAFASRPIDVRFIELMPIGAGRHLEGLSHEILKEWLFYCYPAMTEDPSPRGHGPAVYYQLPGMQGALGLISAESGKFCSSCNRIRLTADAFLKPCLCFENGVDLRPAIAEGKEKVREAIAEQIRRKPMEHCFEEPDLITENRGMTRIGG